MAHCVGAIWCQGSLQGQLSCGLPISKSSSVLSTSPFLPRTAWEDMAVPRFCGEEAARMYHPGVVCFRDDEAPLPEYLVERNWSDMSGRANLEIRYSPWAAEMMNGIGRRKDTEIKESTGGPPGNGKGGDGGDGNGGDGSGDDESEDHIFLLPILTLAFAAFHLGYCIAVWVKDDSLDFQFFRTGLALFALLTVSALRLNARTGIDAYILGLGASVGVMVWTGERSLMKREGSPAGVVALFAASMAVMFTAAIYHTF